MRVIGEADVDSDDDDDAGVGGAVNMGGGRQGRTDITDKGHGALVRNIMAVGDAEAVSASPKAGLQEDLNNLASNKERQKTQDDMMRLRQAIQELCQASNPLACSMDYLQVGGCARV